MSFNNKTAPVVSRTSHQKEPWVMLYTDIPQLMTHTTNVYITAAAAAAYLAIMSVSFLAYCRG